MNDVQIQEINELTEVLSLKITPGWMRIVKDAQAQFDGVANAWFNFPDGSTQLTEARVSAISNRYLIDLMNLYESKLNDIGTEVISREKDSGLQTTDVDNSTDEEEDE